MAIISQNTTKQAFFANQHPKPTKNYTKLCKTKPILKSYQCPQTLLHKQLTKNFASSGSEKTKPIQSQTKPISKSAKMNITCLSQRDYEQKPVFIRKKNKAKSNPINTKSKNEHKLCLHKGLRKYRLLESKKTNPIKPNFSKTKMVIKSGLKMVHFQPKNKLIQYLIAVFFKSWCNESA